MNDTIEKVYFKISEVSKELGIPDSKIRYWINVFDLPIKCRAGKKHSKLYRFTKEDIKTISDIYYFQKKGLKLWAIKDMIQSA